jgi:hypothetical protein
MSAQKYLETSLMIANFMGATKLESDRFYIPFHGIINDNTLELGRGKVMKYHCSWDWLMPVVRKCIEVAADSKDEVMFLSDEYTSILDTVPLANIESVYKVVVEFIKKYNSI